MPSARQVNWAKFRASAVIVAGLLILGTLSFLLTGGTLLEPKTQIYLFIPDATGLAPGSPVRVDGIGVGKVATVALSGSNAPNRVVKVTVTVRSDHLSDIPRDSFAQISAETVVGDQFVDIASGKSEEHIRPGGEIVYKADPELLKSLDLSQFADQLQKMDAVLTDIE